MEGLSAGLSLNEALHQAAHDPLAGQRGHNRREPCIEDGYTVETACCMAEVFGSANSASGSQLMPRGHCRDRPWTGKGRKKLRGTG
ncbi:hypothetical protein D3C78_897310 [compost metagenome]